MLKLVIKNIFVKRLCISTNGTIIKVFGFVW